MKLANIPEYPYLLKCVASCEKLVQVKVMCDWIFLMYYREFRLTVFEFRALKEVIEEKIQQILTRSKKCQ